MNLLNRKLFKLFDIKETLLSWWLPGGAQTVIVKNVKNQHPLTVKLMERLFLKCTIYTRYRKAV